MTTLKKDLIKKAARGASARNADADVEERDERDISLGPFFTAGVLLLGFGLLRRRKLAVGAGLFSIWVDQRSKLGRAIKHHIKERAERMAEAKADQPAEESSP